jgi:hypothetical protein
VLKESLVSHTYSYLWTFRAPFFQASALVKYDLTNHISYTNKYLIYVAFRDKIEVLDLANYIAIACFDVGILVLYYFFEWYQKRRECNDIEENNTTQVDITKELSYDCKGALGTNSLSSEATAKPTS